MNQEVKQKLIDLVDELGVSFDEFSQENQDTYQEICEILGTKSYRVYSQQFPDQDSEIVIEDLVNRVSELEEKLNKVNKLWLTKEEKLLKKSII